MSRPIYLVLTETAKSPPSVHTSLTSARRAARRLGAHYITEGNHGEWYGYETRSDMHADRQGGAPHLIQAQIDRVLYPLTAIRQEEYPRVVLAALCDACGIDRAEIGGGDL